MSKRKMNFIAVAAVAMLLAMSGVASAQSLSPTGDAYSGQAGQIQGGGPTDATDPTAAADVGETGDAGTLPFTGFELGMALLMGAGLLGTGLVIRHGTRSQTA